MAAANLGVIRNSLVTSVRQYMMSNLSYLFPSSIYIFRQVYAVSRLLSFRAYFAQFFIWSGSSYVQTNSLQDDAVQYRNCQRHGVPLVLYWEEEAGDSHFSVQGEEPRLQ